MVVEITHSEFRLARQGAESAARSGRGVLTADDLYQEACIWMVTHPEKVEAWREEGRHGQNKLRRACKQHALQHVAKARRQKSGLMSGDLHYYTPVMVSELLPAIWDCDDWQTSGSYDSGAPKGPSRPAEGNNRLAMIIDIRSAYFSLSNDDQFVLLALHKNSGMPYDVLGDLLGVHERTVRRREERAIERLIERLGGEPPWA